jgi:hypothetical protein
LFCFGHSGLIPNNLQYSLIGYSNYDGIYWIDPNHGNFTLIAKLPPFNSLLSDSFALDIASGRYFFLMSHEGESARQIYEIDLYTGAVKVTPTALPDGAYFQQPMYIEGMLYGFLGGMTNNSLVSIDVATGKVHDFAHSYVVPGYMSSDSVALGANLAGNPPSTVWLTGSLDGRRKGAYLTGIELGSGLLHTTVPLAEPLHYLGVLDPSNFQQLKQSQSPNTAPPSTKANTAPPSTNANTAPPSAKAAH